MYEEPIVPAPPITKMDFPFVNNGNYSLFPLKVTLEKNNGVIRN